MMPLTPAKLSVLQKLAVRPLTVIDLPDVKQLRIVQQLVNEGYARDFAAQRGRRVEVRLRIWGITQAGRAILEQVAMVEASSRQPSLILEAKKPLPMKEPEKLEKKEEASHDGQLWFRNADGSMVPRHGRRVKLTAKMRQDAKHPSKPPEAASESTAK